MTRETRARQATAEAEDALYLVEGIRMVGNGGRHRLTAMPMGWQFVRGAGAADDVAIILRGLGWVRVQCVRWG